jgi:hypothetical protein
MIEGGSRRAHLLYSAGAAVAVQTVDVRVAAPALPRLLRFVGFTRFGGFWGWYPYALVALGIVLAAAGVLAYAADATRLTVIGLSLGLSLIVVGAILLGRDWVILRFALEGRMRWVVIIGTLVVLQLLRVLARQFL